MESNSSDCVETPKPRGRRADGAAAQDPNTAEIKGDSVEQTLSSLSIPCTPRPVRGHRSFLVPARKPTAGNLSSSRWGFGA